MKQYRMQHISLFSFSREDMNSLIPKSSFLVKTSSTMLSMVSELICGNPLFVCLFDKVYFLSLLRSFKCKTFLFTTSTSKLVWLSLFQFDLTSLIF